MSVKFVLMRCVLPKGNTLWHLLLLGALAAAPLHAQTVGTGAINGTITDESGATLPGVVVTASSPALQVPQLTTVSGADGTYRFPSLPAGVHELTFELSGFQKVTRQELRLNSGFVATINVQMKIGTLEESVTIVGQSPVVDVKTTSVQTNFTTEMLETIPVARSQWSIFAAAPGVRVNTPPDVGGNTLGDAPSYGAYGAAGQHTPMIEGLNTREGANATGFFYDYSAFEEVQIKSLGNGAEVATPGTNFVGIVKSGGNEFHGRYVAMYENKRLQSTNLDDALRARGVGAGDKLLKYYDVSGDLGGRLIRDKLWFYGALLRQHNSETVTGFAKDPGPDGRYGTADDVAGTNPITHTNETLKMSFQPKASYKLIGFVQHNVKAEPQRDGTRFRPLETTYDYSFTPWAWKGELQSIPSSKLLINVLGGYVWYWANRPSHPGADRPGNPSRLDLATGMYQGPHNLIFFRFRNHWQSSGSVVYFANEGFGGSHELKVGYNVDLEQIGIDRPDRASGNYLLTFDNGVPFQITTYNLPIEGRGSKMNNYGMYVQDKWGIGDRLTVNLGLRGEQYHSFVDAGTKEQGAFGSAGAFPKIDVQKWWALAPRLGFAFDVTGNAKTVLKASYGRYNFNPSVDFSDRWNGNSLTSSVYRWRDPNGNRDYDRGEVNLSFNGPDFISTTGASTLRINPDLQQPRTHEFSATLEREVANNFLVKTVYVYKRDERLYDATINVARPLSVYDVPITRQDPGPDGMLGTADDGDFITLYDYNPAYRGGAFVTTMPLNRPAGRDDRYQSIEVTAIKRRSHNFDVMGSVVLTKNRQYLVGVSLVPTDSMFDLDTTWNWQTKVSGSYLAPYGIQVAAYWQGLSGTAGQRTYVFRQLPQSGTMTVRLEPYGSQRLPTLHNVNLRVSKQLAFQRYKLDLGIDLYNLFNVNTITGTTYASGPSYGAITQIFPPRILGVRATFAF